MQKSRSSRPVAIWLLVGVFMIIVQIILGGITRLTGSGLSITEWDVVTGALPPLNEQQWLAEFNKYRQTPQFRLLNSDFTRFGGD
jgi:cytochrome c oxidase assembly protein subunit 15